MEIAEKRRIDKYSDEELDKYINFIRERCRKNKEFFDYAIALKIERSSKNKENIKRINGNEQPIKIKF